MAVAQKPRPRTPHPAAPDELPAELRSAFWQLVSVRAYRGGKPFARSDVEYTPDVMRQLVAHGLADEMGGGVYEGRPGEGTERLYVLRPAAVTAAADLGWCQL
jgi:hypothetical protein